MKTAPLVAAAALAAPLPASAATVSLLSLEREVEVVVTEEVRADDGSFSFPEEREREATAGLGAFDAELLLDGGGDFFASQLSEVGATDGGNVAFLFESEAEAPGGSFPFAGSAGSGLSAFFRLDAATAYAFTADFFGTPTTPPFGLSTAAGEALVGVEDAELERVQAGPSVVALDLDVEGVLGAGDYTLFLTTEATGGLDDAESLGLSASFVLLDADLSDGPAVVPTPGALAAGLSLLAAGTLRRRTR